MSSNKMPADYIDNLPLSQIINPLGGTDPMGIDETPTQNSNNAVSSGGVHSKLINMYTNTGSNGVKFTRVGNVVQLYVPVDIINSQEVSLSKKIKLGDIPAGFTPTTNNIVVDLIDIGTPSNKIVLQLYNSDVFVFGNSSSDITIGKNVPMIFTYLTADDFPS